MEQDKKSGTGAPSSDTTSALFVSQRKKQLEQQEVERRAKEKEEQRLAAEAEVRRLEREVEERKRKAEEEAKQVAEEARAKKAQAQANPDAVLGAPVPPAKEKSVKLPKISMPGTASATSGGGVAVAEKTAPDKKKLIIIGAAVAVVVVIGIIIAAVAGGGGSSAGGGNTIPYSSSQKGISFSYPQRWQVDDASAESVTIASEELGAYIILMDITNQINALTDSGMDIVSAAEMIMNTMVESIVGGSVSNLQPQLQKTGDLVTGSASFSFENADMGSNNVDINLTVLDGRCIIDLLGTTDDKKAKQASDDYNSIMQSLEILTGGGAAASDTPATETKTYPEPPSGYTRFISGNGFTMVCPDGWTIADTDGGFSRPVVEISPPGNGFMFVVNFADEGASLSGRDAYDSYVDKMITLAQFKQEDVVSATDVQHGQVGDGMDEYYQIVEYAGGLDVYISLLHFNDAGGNIQGVFIVHPSSDTDTSSAMSTITESIDVA